MEFCYEACCMLHVACCMLLAAFSLANVQAETSGSVQESNEPSSFSGAYASLGGAYDFCSLKLEFENNNLSFSPKYYGILANIGYGYTFDGGLYLGLEGVVSFGLCPTDKKNIGNTGATISVKADSINYGALVRCGYDFGDTPVLVYAVTGLEHYGCTGSNNVNSEKAFQKGFRPCLGLGGAYRFSDDLV